VWGLDRGYCQMIGGENEVVKRLDPIFKTLAPGRGSLDRTPGREKATGTAKRILTLRSKRRWPFCEDDSQWHRIWLDARTPRASIF